jgi:phage terminase large subunit
VEKRSVIEIPNAWEPRSYQLPFWRAMEGGCRRAALVWHRRSGKDSTSLNLTATKMLERVGTYWHMLPEKTQARKVIWDGIDKQGRRMIDQAFPPELVASKYEQDMMLRFKNGSVWQCVGSDNYNSLVGANPVGVVFSEYSVADPRAWDFVSPILAENGGWAVFIYTPRGHNHGYTLFEMAKKNPNWFSQLLTVDDTNTVTKEALLEERESGKSEEHIQQEYYCSFNAGSEGSYYANYIETAKRDGRVSSVPWESRVPVTVAWDLGYGDSTALWFCQRVAKEIRLIDYYENHNVGLDHYCKVLRGKPYSYDTHILPHDAGVHELTSGRSRYEFLREQGIGKLKLLDKFGVDDGIQAARSILPQCWFDSNKCSMGLDMLLQYRKEKDEKRGCYKENPLHDWTSHCADSFRYLALGLKPVIRSDIVRPKCADVEWSIL